MPDMQHREGKCCMIVYPPVQSVTVTNTVYTAGPVQALLLLQPVCGDVGPPLRVAEQLRGRAELHALPELPHRQLHILLVSPLIWSGLIW